MIVKNIFILTIIFVLSVLTSGTSQLIKPFSKYNEKYIGKYHLAQIKPAGKYKVIVWHKIIDKKNGQIYDKIFAQSSKSSAIKKVFKYDQNNFNDYAQYFEHFHNVETDEMGQFLIEKNGRVDEKALANGYYNFTITPMKGTHLLQKSAYELAFKLQKVYAQNIQIPVDSLCNFTAEKRCIINYFETFDERLACLTNLMFIWLTEKFYGVMPERINFFLIAILNDVIHEAKKKSEIPEKMTSDDATILGIIWTYLATSIKLERLLPRIRMVDDQMVELINEFCKINKTFLLEHDDLKNKLKKKYNCNSFCEQWPSKRENLSRFNNKSAVLDAFHRWIYSKNSIFQSLLKKHENSSLNSLDNVTQKIITFWLSMFSWWFNPNVTSPWLQFDIELFHQIGKLFVDAKSKQMLTLKKIGSILTVLDRICSDVCSDCNFYANNEERHHHIVNLWKEQLCDSDHKFKHDVPSIGQKLYNLVKGAKDKQNEEVSFARTSSNRLN